MAHDARPSRMTEPEPIDCVFIEGAYIETRDEIVRLCGWIDLERTAHYDPERRIRVRVAMTLTVGRVIGRDLRRATTRGHH